jgi:hypothetical protein
MDERLPLTHRTTMRLEVWPRQMLAPLITPDPGTFPSMHLDADVDCSWMGSTPDWVVFYAAPDGHLQQFHARRGDWDAGTEAISRRS